MTITTTYGQGTARSTPCGTPLPLVKTQGGEPDRSNGGNHSIYDDETSDARRGDRFLRFGTWNVGTTGRSGEVVEVLVRRRVDICCVQETRWKGSGVRMVKGRQGQKYKFVWQGCPEGVNGVGVLFSEEFVDSVVSVTRVSERLMMVKMMIGKLLVNIISGYAPQVGRSDEEKDTFWCAIEKLMENVKDEEVVVVGGDLNGHVGRSMDGFEGVHGGYGYGVRNGEGERILEFADGADLLICYTQFQKEDNKLVTYTSGGSTTTVDYLLV
uniref:craniofacial development protein 2-like n=1 Tax=Myxine glutinosa TaxID=7769 RepID=UPI00358E89BF